jgi:uncharacterized protein (DUF305 family)
MFRSCVPASLLLVACSTAAVESGPPIVQPGAPGQAARVLDAAEAEAMVRPAAVTPADVAFMQGMILHHAQALEMVHLVPARTTREDIRLLARRIELSQRDEIELMQRWLRVRGHRAPEVDFATGHAAEHGHMPGMLSPDEMARLAAARGEEFDRLFLEGMIHHHEGALHMVAELFAAGGGQETEINQFANEVDADQMIEIERMRAMLAVER